MTISSETRKAGPTPGNGVATAFPFAFKVFTAADLLVVLNTLATGVQQTLILNDAAGYTVVLNADQNANPGGTVTYNPSGVPMPATQTLTISSVVTRTQGTHLINGGAFLADNIENMVDRVVIGLQQMYEQLTRSIRFPIVDAASFSAELPAAAQRASKLLGFDAVGNLQTYVTQIGTSIVNLAAAAGATLIGWIQTGVGTVIRTVASKLFDFVTAEDFGVVGDGVTDDRAAWQLAINDGRDIWGLNKPYLIGAPGLNVPVGRKGLVIRGMFNNTQLIANGAYGIINFPAGVTTRDTVIEGIQFGATGAGDGAATGLAGSADLNYVMFADIRRCTFSAKLRYGITGSWIVSEFYRANFGTRDQPTAGKTFKAFKLRSSAGGGNAFQSMLTFNQCEFNNANDDYVCELEWSMSNHFYRCTWEGNNPTVGVLKMTDCVLNKFERCWNEQNPIHPPAVAGVPFIKGFDGAHPLDVRYEFDGNYFEGLGAGANDVILDNTNHASKQYTLENTQLANIAHFNLDTGNYDLPQNCARLVNNKSAGATTLWVENWYQFRAQMALTMTGCTVPIVVVADVQKVGDMVTVEFSTFAGVSNNVAKTITGLNNIASLLPTTPKPFIPMLISDNGGATQLGFGTLSAAGVLTVLATPAGGAWTAAGVAQIVGTCFTYSVK